MLIVEHSHETVERNIISGRVAGINSNEVPNNSDHHIDKISKTGIFRGFDEVVLSQPSFFNDTPVIEIKERY